MSCPQKWEASQHILLRPPQNLRGTAPYQAHRFTPPRPSEQGNKAQAPPGVAATCLGRACSSRACLSSPAGLVSQEPGSWNQNKPQREADILPKCTCPSVGQDEDKIPSRESEVTWATVLFVLKEDPHPSWSQPESWKAPSSPLCCTHWPGPPCSSPFRSQLGCPHSLNSPIPQNLHNSTNLPILGNTMQQ